MASVADAEQSALEDHADDRWVLIGTARRITNLFDSDIEYMVRVGDISVRKSETGRRLFSVADLRRVAVPPTALATALTREDIRLTFDTVDELRHQVQALTLEVYALQKQVKQHERLLANSPPPSLPVRKQLTAATRARIIRRDSGLCRYCGKRMIKSRRHIDHIMPVSNGGPDSDVNLVVACMTCNSRKSNQLPHHVGMTLLPCASVDALYNDAQQMFGDGHNPRIIERYMRKKGFII